MKDQKSLPKRLKNNPFFQFSGKTHCVPAWDKIRLRHVMPAFEYALKKARENLKIIEKNPANPTFGNTVEAMEHADELACYFAGIIFNVVPRPKDQKEKYDVLIREICLLYQDYFQQMFSSEALYDRLMRVRRGRGYSKLSTEKKYLLESYENGFKDAGIRLNASARKKLYAFENRIAELEITSQENMARAESETFITFSRESDLDGLPEFAKDEAAQKARRRGHKGKWMFSIDPESFAVFMESVRRRASRERMYKAYNARATKGKYNNCPTIIELNNLYQKRAKLLGYVSMADMELGSHMALKPGTVGKFLRLVKKVALPQAKHEAAQLRKFARDVYNIRDFKPWDTLYVRERMKKETIGFDNTDLRPYFELENVLEGTFEHFEKLYGLHFEETNKYPLYHKDVRAFKVMSNRTGRHMGVLFLDLFARDGKPAGTAWSVPIVSQGLFQGRTRKAVNIIVMKLTKPRYNKACLLTHDDVLTLFHEMGHATHDLLSKVRYQSHAGTNVVTDFLEFPSQIAENWTFEPEVLDEFAFHYKTGEPMPETLKEQIFESRSFMAARKIVSSARRGWLDLAWAEAGSGRVRSVAAFEKRVLREFLWSPQYGEMISPSFSHLFGGGYEMSFYGYQWAEALAADAYNLFEKKGLYDRNTAQRLKKLKQQGGSRDSSVLYREFRYRCAQMTKFFTQFGLWVSGAVTMDMLYSSRRTAAAAIPAKRAIRQSLKRRMHPGRSDIL